MKQYAQIFFLMLLTSCTSQKDKEVVSTIKVSEVAQDIKLPRNLFKELEKEITDDLKTTMPVFVYMPLQVEFRQKSPGVLKDSPLIFSFEKGGGQVDLKEVVSGQGTFFMSFPTQQFLATADLMHLYFISQSPVRKIDGESFGLGCGRWIDIKSRFKKLQESDFLKLNTTELRHLAVLAGHYVFVFKQTNQIYLSQLSITDSRYTKDLCISTGENE